MKKKDVSKSALPPDYFKGKDGTKYRFTIFKDIAVAGSVQPIPYDDIHRQEIIDLYSKRKEFAIYVHCPWCIEHCSYCHYYRGPMLKRNELEHMLEAEKQHLEMIDREIDLRSRKVNSIYFGGGTPTVLPTDLLENAISYHVDRYGGKDCEVCLECSPITLKPQKIAVLERYINRLSVGVQSFDDKILKLVERKHTGALAKEVLAEVIPRFASVNVDLIYGLYEQNLSEWLKTIETTINLKSQSVTIYRLDIREIPAIHKVFHDEPEKFPDELMCQQMYEEARRLLLASGYRENLIGWFLLPQVKDTVVYRERWEKQTPCIGLGPALHNYGADHFYETLPGHAEYIATVQAGKLPIKHVYPLTPEKKTLWYVMAQLKSSSPVYKSVIKERFGESMLNWFLDLARNYLEWQVLIEADESGDRLELSPEHHFILEWMLVEMIACLK